AEAEAEAGDNATGIAAASGGIGVLFLFLVGICVLSHATDLDAAAADVSATPERVVVSSRCCR
ncbi:hypothetical protein T484DRAFT_1892189, partial [Baffinella frigidus]